MSKKSTKKTTGKRELIQSKIRDFFISTYLPRLISANSHKAVRVVQNLFFVIIKVDCYYLYHKVDISNFALLRDVFSLRQVNLAPYFKLVSNLDDTDSNFILKDVTLCPHYILFSDDEFSDEFLSKLDSFLRRYFDNTLIDD